MDKQLTAINPADICLELKNGGEGE
jgi:hypothetical protein